jgi:uncharacterized protein YecE (DUF72 family)
MDDWSPKPPPVSGSTLALPSFPAPGLIAGNNALWKPWDVQPDCSAGGVLVGAGGYDFDDWAGRFYPPAGNGRSNTKVTSREGFPGEKFPGEKFPVERFRFYQLYFSFMEIGHTFHQEPMLAQFIELERRSKAGMRFAVKVHRDISHKGVWDPGEGKSLMRKHAEAVSPLAESGRFHSFLIQLDDRLERNRKILDYLLETSSAALSEGLDVHIEFRNRTWHQEAVLQSLKDAGVGICNTEIPALPHAFPLKAYATTDKGYVRYSGLNLRAWTDWKARESSEGGLGARRGSPSERLKAGSARHDYLYSRAQLEERISGQIQILRKAGSVAVAFMNHVGAGAALNAMQNIHLLSGGSSSSTGLSK